MTKSNGRPNEEDQVPSAEPRQPQLNPRVCSCNCSFRGFVTGDGEAGERGVDGDDADKVWLAGDEGVNTHMLSAGTSLSPTLNQYEPFNVDTQYVRYEHGRNGFVMTGVLESSSAVADDDDGYKLRRPGSDESMMMHGDGSGKLSMASSIYQITASSQSTTQLVVGTGSQFGNTVHHTFSSSADMYTDPREFSENVTDDELGH
ncbi:uncharacterized protein PV09_01717 [Verruconis gallopava]|uniref:Uncharacterized protein n=1 Tax=Verruconis gallopava TaxID=253628 RepID=A0A0D2ALZ5_9PEZI|nr:uncharacterized protein PV09_01717 [Verruconis gallopava]KIW07793.1 hypothetical protein PV09_01717 [Verruconis gallopava]